MKNKKKKEQDNERVEIVYALRHKKCGKLLRMDEVANDHRDFCNETTVRLEHFCNDEEGWHHDTWFIDSELNAEYVRQYPTPWYNSEQRTPDHHFEPEDLEVVEVCRIVSIKPIKVKIPTCLEYMRIQYSETDPDQVEYIEEEIKKGTEYPTPYHLWDLMTLVDNGKWNPEEISDDKSDKS